MKEPSHTRPGERFCVHVACKNGVAPAQLAQCDQRAARGGTPGLTVAGCHVIVSSRGCPLTRWPGMAYHPGPPDDWEER